MTETNEKPTATKIIGWIFIALSISMVLSAIMGLLSSMAIKQLKESITIGSEETARPFIVSIIYEYFADFAVLQIAIGVLIFVAAVQFLKFKSWARTVLEIVSWAGLIFVVGFGTFWIYFWMSTPSEVSNIIGAIFGGVAK